MQLILSEQESDHHALMESISERNNYFQCLYLKQTNESTPGCWDTVLV